MSIRWGIAQKKGALPDTEEPLSFQMLKKRRLLSGNGTTLLPAASECVRIRGLVE